MPAARRIRQGPLRARVHAGAAASLLAALAAALAPPPLSAQFLRTLFTHGDGTDSFRFGRIVEMDVYSGGTTRILSELDSVRTERWFDAQGRIVPEPRPRPRARPELGPGTDATWTEALPPDTVPLEPRVPASADPRWLDLGDGTYAWVQLAAGRVAFYAGAEGAAAGSGPIAVREGTVGVPAARAETTFSAELGLERASARAGGRVLDALPDGSGRAWILLGWSGRREEWAVLDPADVSLVELIVLPGAFLLQTVRGRRLYGIQRGEVDDVLHVMERGR